MRFGYIGLGNMGGAIAKRMILKHDIIVFDLSDKLMEDFSKLGAVPATSIADVGGVCRCNFFMLTHFK